MKLHAHALALAGAVVSAACMLLLSVLNALGIYQSAAGTMADWHMFYAPDVGGTIAGMIEAAVISYIVLYAFAWVYGKCLPKK